MPQGFDRNLYCYKLQKKNMGKFESLKKIIILEKLKDNKTTKITKTAKKEMKSGLWKATNCGN